MVLDMPGLFGLFGQSSAMGVGFSPDSQQAMTIDIGTGIIPIGTILPWLKSFSGVPSLSYNFVECNGQVLHDGDSPLDGKTLPNLNAGYFLRGDPTSGTTGGSIDHTHTQIAGAEYSAGTKGVSTEDNIPPFYTVVWIMRIK